ncbi:MAG: protein translocase subunit SecF [Dehalococcoidia bacterium]|nr:protein translocase subunit SecF [Dehalococcoidia bacterium]
MLDFAGKRWWYMGFSLIFVVIAAVALAIPPRLKAGIEFTAGSSFTEQFENPVSQGDLRSFMKSLGYEEVRIQGAGTNTYLIRTRELEGAPTTDATGPSEPGELENIESALAEKFGPRTRTDYSTVSSTVSSEIARNATIAVAAASLAIVLYLWFAFRQMPKPYRYGTCAVIALMHDAFVILGLFSILGKLFDTEVDTAFVTAILTVIGFSVHDTIVVFDRIRETVTHDPFIPFEEAVNASLTETLARSINTSFVVVLTVLAMLLIGGVTIRNFLLVLLVGVVSGTYSSIGIAAQLLVAWENNDIGRFFRKITGRPARREAEATI